MNCIGEVNSLIKIAMENPRLYIVKLHNIYLGTYNTIHVNPSSVVSLLQLHIKVYTY